MGPDPSPPPEAVVTRIARIALALPEARQEDAWRGTRWRVRTRTFAHVMTDLPDRPSAYREATGRTDCPVTLRLRAEGEELQALLHAGLPFFGYHYPQPTVVGMVLDEDTDWQEVAELVTESYRFCAPARLARLLP